MKVFSHHISPQLLLIALIDTALAVASFYLSNVIVPVELLDLAPSEGPMLHLNGAIFAAFVIAGQIAMGVYSGQQRYQINGVVARTMVGLAMAAIGLSIADFVLEFVGSRTEWLTALLVAAVLLSIGRTLTSKLVDEDIFRRRVIVYGAGTRASCILELRRRSDQRGFKIVAFLPAEGDTEIMDDDRVIRNSDKTLTQLVDELDAAEIVVAVDDRRRDFRISELLECKLAGINVVDLLAFLERETGRVKVGLMIPSWLIFSEQFQRLRANQLGFRMLDVLTCLVLLVPAIPVMGVIALLILAVDGAPVLYRQRRVGLAGRHFTLYKFRSMRTDAEADGGAVWAADADERVTRVGRFLRKYRLDEIPQLFNVLAGSMSFVGPRPERPEFVSDLSQRIPYYHERHCVKPGITGWAQLCYPYGASEKDALAKLEYDMYYVKYRSIFLNLVILLQTVEVVLWQKGSR